MKFRYARHTKNLDSICEFYISILEFENLGGFENHNSYDGIFLGKSNSDWHLEFTVSDDVPNQIFDEDDALVFYPETLENYNSILKNIEKHSVEINIHKNPYWNENGVFIKDPDGFGIIISKRFAE